jgi:hypothetical protein
VLLIILIILILLLLGGGGYGWRNGGNYAAPLGGIGFILLVILIVYLVMEVR